MPRPSTGAIAFLVASLAMAGGATQRAQETGPRYADLVVRGGKVVTVDTAGRIAGAVAVVGDRIAAVGDTAQVNTWIGPSTRVIELQGRALLPGFIDAHSHVLGLAESEHLKVPIQVPTPRKDVPAIMAALERKRAEVGPNAWIFGQGTYYQPMPTRDELDAAFPENPVVLWWSFHDQILNHRAAVALGLTKDAPDPVSGRYERASNGEVAIVRDAAVAYPVPRFTAPQAKDALRSTLTDFYRNRGVTTVVDLSDPTLAYRAYQELRADGELPTRLTLNFMLQPDAPDDDDPRPARTGPATTGNGQEARARTSRLLRAMLASGLHTGFGDDWIRIGAIKIVLDGVWGTTAATYKPFWKGPKTTWSAENLGSTNFTAEELNRLVLDAHRGGWQLMVHALGDRAQDMLMDAFDAAQQAAPRTDARLRIEHVGHAWVLDDTRQPGRVARMKHLGAIPSPQVSMLWRYSADDLEEPGVKFFPLRTMIDAGFEPPNGADTLGTQNFATDPLFALARAVRRDSKYGVIVHPEEAIAPMDAIRMCTIWAARAAFLETSRGSIEVGKLADMVVLSADPLTTPPATLPELAVDATILGGRIVYTRR